MASEVYVLSRVKGREALWQLSEKDSENLNDKMRKSLEGIAVKRLARFSVGQSVFVHLTVWPDMESFHKVQVAWGPQGLNVQRYWDVETTIGHEAPAPGDGATGLSFAAQDDLPLV